MHLVGIGMRSTSGGPAGPARRGVTADREDPGMGAGRAELRVLYTEQPEACRAFYAGLGLDLVREHHGAGPVHYAAELAHGLVLEIYPAAAGRATGRLRLGLVVAATGDLPAGEHTLADPDGRTVVVTAENPGGGRRARSAGPAGH